MYVRSCPSREASPWVGFQRTKSFAHGVVCMQCPQSVGLLGRSLNRPSVFYHLVLNIAGLVIKEKRNL